MTRLLFVTATALGASAIAWMTLDFAGSHSLALAITLVIAAVYAIGIWELVRYRRASGALLQALATPPQDVAGERENLDQWLRRLPAALANPVARRINGEPAALPAPVITPYLVGLLVMLGLLGTFAGMVETLGGAVTALEGSTELEAIRAGLAAPIKGLGLAFGTSVAGIAASAMLGLNATLCRRERLLASRQLDSALGDLFYHYSTSYQQQQTFSALREQAAALPRVADTLTALSARLAGQGERIAQGLQAQQQALLSSTSAGYRDLASTVDRSLRETLGKGTAQVAATLETQVGNTLAVLAAEAGAQRDQLAADCQASLQQLAGDSRALQQRLLGDQQALKEQLLAEASALREQLSEDSRALHDQLHCDSQALLEQLGRDSETLLSRLSGAAEKLAADGDTQRQAANDMAENAARALAETGSRLSEEIGSQTGKLVEINADAADSTANLAALSDAFAAAVAQYNDSNTRLTESLARIERALDESNARSDEQMAYYVAQAREIIDQSVSSQRAIIEDLRQAGRQGSLLVAEAG